MWVMTIDQVGSRRIGDRVAGFLTELGPYAAHGAAPTGVVRPFERTVGDEVQGLLDDPALVVRIALDVLRHGGWSIGIGAGDVDRPLPASVRAGSGAAFVLAREAVEAAKRRTRHLALAVRGADVGAAEDAEAVLVLIAAAAARRSEAGWTVVDALRAAPEGRQTDVAARLGISQQAVSQRLRTALWAEEVAARPAAARLLGLAAGPEREPGARGTLPSTPPGPVGPGHAEKESA